MMFACLYLYVLFADVFFWFAVGRPVLFVCGISWPGGYNSFTCSTQLSIKFILLIKIKMPLIDQNYSSMLHMVHLYIHKIVWVK